MSASPTAPLALSAPQAGAGGVTIGSLCSGYEGLGMAVQQVLGGRLAWVADPDPGASAVLAHHWPAIPNLGDITVTDWDQVEPVDIVTAGYPCQPFSLAGKRGGAHDVRHIWPHVADAIRRLRPRLVFLENVAGHLSMGFGHVLGDLAALGFDAEWRTVRASDVGAPHRRERLFVVAHAADERPVRSVRARGRRPGPADGGLTVADAQSHGRDERRAEPAGQQRGSDAAFCGHAPADPASLGHQNGPQRDHRQFVGTESRSGDGTHQRAAAPRVGRVDDDPAVLAWGHFGPAVDRWERVLGRAAPVPTELGPRGNRRLSPAFVEWMQGLPAGHVTAVPGLTRNQQLKLLGNGVVPQQGAHALAQLLARAEVPAWT